MKRAVRFQILAAALLSSCASAAPIPRAICVSECGVRLMGRANCEAFKHTEAVTLRAFARTVPGWTFPKMCAALQGWTVFVHPRSSLDRALCENGFVMPQIPFCLAGLTHVWSREIEVSDSDWPNNSLSHEYVHALQTDLKEPIGHCFWTERGIVRALNTVHPGRSNAPRLTECASKSELPRSRVGTK